MSHETVEWLHLVDEKKLSSAKVEDDEDAPEVQRVQEVVTVTSYGL